MESSVWMFQILTNMIFAKFYACGTEDSTQLENEQSWYLPIDSLSEMKSINFPEYFLCLYPAKGNTRQHFNDDKHIVLLVSLSS